MTYSIGVYASDKAIVRDGYGPDSKEVKVTAEQIFKLLERENEGLVVEFDARSGGWQWHPQSDGFFRITPAEEGGE